MSHHPKRKEFPGVTKVTTPGRSKNSQIAINQHVEHNTRSQVWEEAENGNNPSFSGIKPAASSPSSLRESEQAPIPLCSSWIPRRGFAASAIPLRLRRSLPSKQKKAFGASSKAVFVLWRRRRDSNPRSSYPDTAFRVRPDRPLRHFSINCRTKVILFYVGCSLFASFFLRVKLRIGSTK
jgi:hypothetical protein